MMKQIRMLMGAVVMVAAAAGAASADSACQVTAQAELICVDAQATCIVDATVHVCLADLGALPCLKDLSGHILWLPLQTVCKDGGDVITKPTTGPIPACEISLDAELLCVDATATSCLFDAEIYLCDHGNTLPPIVDPVGPLLPPHTGGGILSGGNSPTGTDPTPTPDPYPTDPTWEASGGGCSAAHGSGGGVVLMLGAVGFMLRRRKRVVALAIISSAGIANADTIDADLFRTNTIGEGGVIVGNTDTIESGALRMSALSDYANDPVELRNTANANDTRGVVDHLSTLDLRVGVGLPGGFELGLVAPMVLDREGMEGLHSSGVGDVGGFVKWGARGQRFGVALSSETVAPTGSRAGFATDGAWGELATVLADVKLGQFRFGAEGGFHLRQHDEAYMGAKVGQQALWGGIADYTISAAADVHLIAEVHGAVTIGDEVNGNPSEALGEARWKMGEWMAVAGAGMGLSSAVGVPDWRAFAGLAYTLGGKKETRKPIQFAAIEQAKPMPMPEPQPAPEPAKIIAEQPAPQPAPIPEPAPQPVPAAQPAPTYVFEMNKALVFHDIHFATAKWKILPESFSVLDDIADSLRKQPTVHIRIEGHTDGRGTDDGNLTLSQQRALATMNYLIAAGIDPARLDYTGFGKSRPVASNSTADGMAENRRVEVRTTSK